MRTIKKGILKKNNISAIIAIRLLKILFTFREKKFIYFYLPITSCSRRDVRGQSTNDECTLRKKNMHHLPKGIWVFYYFLCDAMDFIIQINTFFRYLHRIWPCYHTRNLNTMKRRFVAVPSVPRY